MKSAARRAFERAAPTASEDFVVSREAARRMEQRLDYVTLRPARVLDAGCGAGADLALLRHRYPQAELVGIDSACPLLKSAFQRRSLGEHARNLFGRPASRLACADIARLPFRNAFFGMVWSNIALAWLREPLEVFREFARVLEPGGLLMFSTYGPDTLKELRACSALIDSREHVQTFLDMHDLGDMLIGSGFAEPVMDIDMITLTYPDVAALIADLRQTGQTYVAAGRRRGLMGRDAWQRMLDAYEARRRDGRIPASVELVFGHAWKSERARRPAKINVFGRSARGPVLSNE